MAANSKNREEARDHLATLLTAAMTGASNPGQEVTNYEKGLIEAVPLTQVFSGGSGRSQHGMNREKWRNRFRLIVRNIVPDASTDESWSEQDVEDRLDLMEKTVADVVADNRETAYWRYIDYEEGAMSTIAPVRDAGGNTYMMEELSLIVTAYDD
jgi:hypothetical protein